MIHAAGRLIPDAILRRWRTQSCVHGNVALVNVAARQSLGLPSLLGPVCHEADPAYVLRVSRVVAPTPKLATLAWCDVTLGPDLGITDVIRQQHGTRVLP